MFTSLRARLWVTYAILILLILGTLAIGVFVYVIRNPLIDRLANSRLETALNIIQRQLSERSALIRDELVYLRRVSDSLSIRALLFSRQGELLLDSEPESGQIGWAVGESAFRPQGQITDQEGKTWIYHSLVLSGEEVLVLAVPRQGGLGLLRSPRLRETLREDFLPTFTKTGLVALILAVVFAAWMGSWIANPLEKIEAASQAVSRGHYQQIPLQGPDEVRALAGAFNSMVDQVESFQQSQRDFVANVSHELKTPLTSIQGFSQAILDGTSASGPAQIKAAGIIKAEADRMYRLVVDLLDLARIDAGTVGLDRSPLDIGELLTYVVNQMIPQAVQAQVKLSLDLGPLPTCLGDQDRLAQVFTNLVDNAIKHSPAGGSVKLSAQAEGEQVRVEVSDSGPGIPPEHLERIFERFYKIDGSRRSGEQPGTGLGLAIAQGIVRAHAGEIVVRSTAGHGSVFAVSLPLGSSADLAAAKERLGSS